MKSSLVIPVLLLLVTRGCIQPSNNSAVSSTDVDQKIEYCDFQKIHRDDGTTITQGISLPVASDESLEFGMAVASNGINEFITVTIRFLNELQGITGDLSIRLVDNEMLTIDLINEGKAFIGNNQVTQGVYALSTNDIERLVLSELFTVSVELEDGLMHTLECTLNSAIIKDQLSCLIRDRNSIAYKSDSYDYTVLCPKEFVKEDATGRRIDMKFVNSDGSSIVINVSDRMPEEYNISAHDYTKEMLEEVFKQASPSMRITKAEKTFIDNNEAFLVHNYYPTKSLKAIEVYFYKGEKAFVLTGTSKTDQFEETAKKFTDTFYSIKFN